MSETIGSNFKTIIDVVEEFDYSTQNEVYNENFRRWRRDKANDYAFNFRVDKRESVFVDGKGFVRLSSEDAEKHAVSRVMYVVGVAMLIWTIIDNIVGRCVGFLLGAAGMDVNGTFFGSALYGGGTGIITALIITAVLKVTVPMIYVRKTLKVPVRAELMSTMNDSVELIGAIGLALAFSAVVSLPKAYSTETFQLYTFFKNVNADIRVWGQTEFIIYAVFDIVFMSLLSEMFFRGAMFAALRQFGDLFAVIITSVTAGLLTQDIREVIPVMAISVIASVGMLRSGSLFTAISSSIVYKMFQLAVVIAGYDDSENAFFIRNMLMLGAFLLGSSAAAFVYIKKRKPAFGLSVYESELALKGRLLTAAKSFPFIAVVLVCIMAIFIRVMY